MSEPEKKAPMSFAGPSITKKEVAYVTEAVENAWYQGAGEFTKKFETAFAGFLGVKYALSLPSCTSAIHLALKGLDIGPGDQVILPDLTWIATAAPIVYVGAEAVFADVDPITWCIDAEAFEAAITKRTKAVIIVHLYGGMPNMDTICEIAEKHGIAIIEDAAGAIGSLWRGRRAGAIGRAGVFSFHGSKTLTTGEGGMLTTNDPDIYARAHKLSNHGRPSGDFMFRSDEIGFKYKMTDLQAALGLAQLERANELIARKREIMDWYRDELVDLSGIHLNAEPPNVVNGYWMASVVFDRKLGIDKDRMVLALRNAGIDGRPFFDPLSSLAPFRETSEGVLAKQRNHIAYDLSYRGINLPSGFLLTRQEVTRVCNVLREHVHCEK